VGFRPERERLHGRAIALEEIDGDDMTVRVSATPSAPDDGPALADEVLAALTSVSGDGGPR
jgi:hypothetical protein